MISYLIGQDLSLPQFIILATSFLVAVLLALTMHEMAHGYVALWNGDDTAKRAGRLSFNPVVHFDLFGFLMLMFVGFGYAKPVPVNPINFRKYRKGMFRVSVAGVITNLALAFLLYPLLSVAGSGGSAAYGSVFLQYLLGWIQNFLFFFVIININLALFNILPIAPLDGFNAVASVTNRGNRFVSFIARYSRLILLLLILWEYMPIVGEYSPLSLYIGYGQGGIMWLYSKFWGLFGL